MTTYYVDGAVGNDTNDGLAEGAGNAWATIQKAADTALNGGDIIYVKNSVTYTEEVTQSVTPTGYSNANPLRWIGYSDVPGDFGRVVIDSPSSYAWYITYQVAYGLWMNFSFTGGSTYGFNHSFGSGDSACFYNCEFRNNGSSGFYGDNVNSFFRCDIRNNGFHGLDIDNDCMIIACKIHNNTQKGVYVIGSLGVLYKTLVYDNGAEGVEVTSNLDFGACNSIINNSGAFGLETGAASQAIAVLENVVYGNNIGINIDGVNGVGLLEFFDYNAYYNNTTNIAGVTDPFKDSLNDVLGDPRFIDEANDDYRVRQNSPLVGAGITPGVFT
jgi:hypothetical protein